jgi:hypothetical protein
MDKRADGLTGAMREIAEQRDNQLCDGGAISAERLEQLQVFLAAERPVEMALFAAARQRDKSLSLPEPVLPAVVHAALVERVRTVRGKANPFGVLRQIPAWLRAPRWSEVYRTAAIAAVAIVMTSAVLHFSRSRDDAATQLSTAPLSSIPTFSSDVPPLNLGVRRIELASLDPSLLTIKGALPHLEQPGLALPLDLPVRQIRLDVEALRTP